MTRFRYARPPITTWAGSRWTIRAAARSRGSGPAARSPRPACMGPTAWRATRSSRRWPMPPGLPRTSKGLQHRSLDGPAALTASCWATSRLLLDQQSQRSAADPVHHGSAGWRAARSELDCRTPSVACVRSCAMAARPMGPPLPLVGLMIAVSAYRRNESRGAHQRLDHPDLRPEQHTEITLDQALRLAAEIDETAAPARRVA